MRWAYARPPQSFKITQIPYWGPDSLIRVGVPPTWPSKSSSCEQCGSLRIEQWYRGTVPANCLCTANSPRSLRNHCYRFRCAASLSTEAKKSSVEREASTFDAESGTQCPLFALDLVPPPPPMAAISGAGPAVWMRTLPLEPLLTTEP